MAGLDLRWLTAFADVPADRFADDLAYWSAITGARPGEPVGDRFVPLEPDDGDRHVWLQRVDAGEGGWHLDCYVPDPDAALPSVIARGGRLRERGQWWLVCESPGGLAFCLVAEYADTRRRAPAARWPAGRSGLDQFCIDIPPASFDAEVEFWAALTGWPRHEGNLPEFNYLDRNPQLPLRILLQRLGATDHDGIRAHVDLACDDRAGEVARHVAAGGRITYEASAWTTLLDAAGLTYCVTDRPPLDGPDEPDAESSAGP